MMLLSFYANIKIIKMNKVMIFYLALLLFCKNIISGQGI